MRRIFGMVSFFVAAVWELKWEVVRAFLYDRGFHFMGLMEADTWVHWGPTFALVGCGPYLFWRTGKQKASTPEVNAPVVREAHAPAVKNPVRDVAVGEAIAYLGVQEWGKSFFDIAKSNDIDAAKLYDDFLQAAADGTVPVWGKKTNNGVYEPVSREFRYENRIDWFGLLKASAHTESSKHSFRADRYNALMTSRAAVESLVPEEIEGARYPNVRAADNPSIHDEILGGRDRDKFLAFLSSGEIDAWARPMFGTSDYVKIPSNAWDTHRIDVQLHSGDSVGPGGVHQVHHQSYLRRKTGTKEATHYDVAFNRAQLKGISANAPSGRSSCFGSMFIFHNREANMKRVAFSVIIIAIAIVAASAEVYAATCYKKVGGACVQSSTGSLNSSCTADCADGEGLMARPSWLAFHEV